MTGFKIKFPQRVYICMYLHIQGTYNAVEINIRLRNDQDVQLFHNMQRSVMLALGLPGMYIKLNIQVV